MPYRVKRGETVVLIGEGVRKSVTLNRTIDFNKKELVVSPLVEHHQDGVPVQIDPNMPAWGFSIAGKWENQDLFSTLYAEEVHEVAQGQPKHAQTVVVPGSGTNEYTLTLDSYGNPTSCTCRGFRYQRKECKHMRRYRLMY